MRAPTVELGEICEINPTTGYDLDAEDACSFVPMEAVDDIDARIVRRLTRPFHEVAKGYTPFAENDVIVAKITPCMENGKCAIGRSLHSGVGFGSTEFHVLRATDRVIPEWLFYFWRYPLTRRFASLNMTGSAGQKRVPASYLETARIPLPDLPEQQWIARLLEQADRVRRMRRYALDVSGTFLHSSFLKLFGSPSTALKRFPVSKLGEVAGFVDYRGIAPNKTTKGIRLITARNIKRGHFEVDPQEFIPAEEYEGWMTRGMPRPGDVLFTTEGHTLGSAAKLPAFSKVALAQRLIALQPGKDISSDYLLSFVLSPLFQAQVVKHSTGSAARGISSKNLADLPIPVPPKSLQQQFARYGARIERLRDLQREALRQADHLFQSLLHEAFRTETTHGESKAHHA
jgi:type I restriction enzyme, S subunit